MSKIPFISLLKVYPGDSLRVNVDTVFMSFRFSDGDADIANDNASKVFVKDNRTDSFMSYSFPSIDDAVLDPKKGITGTCFVLPVPQPEPRQDTFHVNNGDTFRYEVYITDRAGNASNHITTSLLSVKY